MGKKKWGGIRKGAGRLPLTKDEKKKGVKIYLNDIVKEDIIKYGKGNSFSSKALDLICSEIENRKKEKL